MAVLTTARMTALSPGQSPPPVSMPILEIFFDISGSSFFDLLCDRENVTGGVHHAIEGQKEPLGFSNNFLKTFAQTGAWRYKCLDKLQAINVVAIYDPYPKGHKRSTIHDPRVLCLTQKKILKNQKNWLVIKGLMKP